MPTPQGILTAAFDVLLLVIILFRINWLPDIANYLIAFVLVFFAVYELAT
jgi:MFS superfamily sulfate permease-like transporter